MKYLFYLTVFLSFMTQVPFILDSGLDGPMKMIWAVTFATMVFLHTDSIIDSKIRYIYICTLPFFMYCAFMDSTTTDKYLNVDVTNVMISLMVFITSYIFFKHYSEENTLRQLSKIALIGAAILSFTIYTVYFTNYDIMDRGYAYQEKNSAAQILLCCITFAAIFWRPNTIFYKSIKYFVILSISVLIIMLKSRATLIGVLYIVYYLIFKTNNKTLQRLTIGASLLAFAYIFLSHTAYDVIINGILLGSRDANDIDDLSSGRVSHISDAMNMITNHTWTGVGNYYLDCMPIAMILQFGIIGATMVFIYIGKIWYDIYKLDKRIDLHLCTYLIFIPMMLNSLFEAQPPFGPGMKCFLLWMMLGFSMAYESIDSEEEEEMESENQEEDTETVFEQC